MIKKSVLFLAGLSVVAITANCFAGSKNVPTVSAVEAKFQKILRNTKINSIQASPIDGLYEVVAGPNVFYFSPKGEGHLIFGQIVDSEGKNLTGDKLTAARGEYQKIQEKNASEKLKNLPLESAVKIGNGPNVVIEFTDPDCPYCRKVDNFLSKRNDLTRYVFLFPLDKLHPKARAKSIYVLNNKEQEKALHEVFAGKYDNGPLPIASDAIQLYPEAMKRLAAGEKMGKELGVEGTPMLFVNGTMVNGADFEKIGRLLNK